MAYRQEEVLRLPHPLNPPRFRLYARCVPTNLMLSRLSVPCHAGWLRRPLPGGQVSRRTEGRVYHTAIRDNCCTCRWRSAYGPARVTALGRARIPGRIAWQGALRFAVARSCARAGRF